MTNVLGETIEKVERMWYGSDEASLLNKCTANGKERELMLNTQLMYKD